MVPSAHRTGKLEVRQTHGRNEDEGEEEEAADNDDNDEDGGGEARTAVLFAVLARLTGLFVTVSVSTV